MDMDIYQTSASYQPGREGNEYVAIFECPTSNEEREQRPVVGVTGCNLCRLLEIIRNHDGYARSRFGSLRKCEITIVNASTHVHEAGEDVLAYEINEHAGELWNQISRCQYVLIFGEKAETGFKKAREHHDDHKFSKVISTYHLSPNGLRHIKVPGRGRQGSTEWTLWRLKLIAEYIISKFRASSGKEFFIDDFSTFLNGGKTKNAKS